MVRPSATFASNRPKCSLHALPQRLQGLEAVAALGGVQADALARAVIDGHEDVGRPLAGGDGGRHVGAPHRVRLLGRDRAVVGLRAVGVAAPAWGLEVMLPHQPPDPLGGRADAPMPQPRPDLAVALAVERALGQDPADVADQLLVGAGPDRAPLLGHGPPLGRDGLPGLEVVGGGAGQAEDAADPLEAVAPAGAGGGGAG